MEQDQRQITQASRPDINELYLLIGTGRISGCRVCSTAVAGTRVLKMQMLELFQSEFHKLGVLPHIGKLSKGLESVRASTVYLNR